MKHKSFTNFSPKISVFFSLGARFPSLSLGLGFALLMLAGSSQAAENSQAAPPWLAKQLDANGNLKNDLFEYHLTSENRIIPIKVRTLEKDIHGNFDFSYADNPASAALYLKDVIKFNFSSCEASVSIDETDGTLTLKSKEGSYRIYKSGEFTISFNPMLHTLSVQGYGPNFVLDKYGARILTPPSSRNGLSNYFHGKLNPNTVLCSGGQEATADSRKSSAQKNQTQISPEGRDSGETEEDSSDGKAASGI